MPKVKISEFDIDPANNTDINSINIAEGCAPSGINNAIRQLMSDLKEWQSGAGDYYIAPAGTVSAPAITTTGDTNTGIFFPAADTIAFSEGGTESMRIDSSGNLGLGVTPTTSTFGGKIIQGTGATLQFYNANEFDLLQNAYYSNGYKYLASGAASNYLQGAGKHLWFNAPSGTAGNAITFTQAMTLDASGNLGIRATSPNAQLSLKSPSASGDQSMFEIQAAGSASKLLKMVINQGADVYTFGTDIAGSLAFQTNATERMRIDSSGNLSVGATGALVSNLLARANIQGSVSNAPAIAAAVSGASYTGSVLSLGSGTNAGTGWNLIQGYSANSGADQFGVLRFQVRGDGNVTNSNNSYGGISDVKLKENIVDATPKLEQLCQVKVRNYNLIGDSTKQLGVVAQELEQVFPSMIDESPDKDAEGNDLGTTTKSVKYSVFVPMLIKAIQEQQAIITDLKARIETLENK